MPRHGPLIPRGTAAWFGASFLLALSLWAGGCTLSHQRCDACGPDASSAARPDAAARDAHIPDAHTTDTPDAGADAASADAGMLCMGPTDRFAYACVFAATGTLPAGRSSTLPVFFDRCECRECAVSVEGQRLSLATRACDYDCDECTFDASCRLPALAEGDYELVVDDAWIGRVRAEPPEPTDVGRPRCLARQETDAPPGCEREPSAPLPLADEVCMRELIDVGTSARLELRATLPCELATATCTVRLDGARLVVTPAVSACPDSCAPGALVDTAIRCVGPPLRDGRYTVEIELGSERFTRALTVRDITVPGDVVCSPAT